MMRPPLRPAGLTKTLPALLLALLGGCSSVAVSLGLRIRLDQVPVTSISATLVDRYGAPVAALGPGQAARLVVVATASDGKRYPSVGAGHNGFPPGSSGLDGQPGSDGRPGAPGAGGTIEISVDPAARPFLRCITWSNRSGDGLPGPKPTISVEPIAPLW